MLQILVGVERKTGAEVAKMLQTIASNSRW